jgi:type I restriction enzyme S subunit
MLGMVAGVAITRLTLAKLNDAMIPLPPVEEQRRIVEEIDRYQSDVVRLESEIAAKRKRMEAAIDAVWQGNSRADNGSELVRPDAR